MNCVLDSEVERPRFDGVEFPTISDANNVNLISPFTLFEIAEVVKESDDNFGIY
jgi:hypothetical protein